jgi:peptidoglycan DL-endopeptidase CwlO
MKKPILLTALFAVLLAGCVPDAPRHTPRVDPSTQINKAAPGETETGIDNRASDPAVLEKDKLLHMGDKDVEEKIPNYIPQEGAQPQRPEGSNVQQHTKADWWRLHEVKPNPAIQPAGGDLANNVIAFGSLFFGTPYEYGSDRSSPNTFDCSDFTRWAFLGALGMDLPKDSRSQRKYVQQFSKRKYRDLSQAKKGDLLFFMDYKGWQPGSYKGIDVYNQRTSHVGIYMGNGKMLHTASKSTGGVRIDTLAGKHYQYRFQEGGSVLP